MKPFHLFLENFIKDSCALFHVRQWNVNLQVESTCSQHSLIHQIQSVSSSHDNYFFSRGESIHLAQKLIDGGCGLVAVSEMVHPASQGIDFVYKDDASFWTFSGCREQLSDSFGSYPHIHLLKLRSSDSKELATCFSGECSGQHSFPCSWRPIEENSSSDSGSHLLVFQRVPQEVNGFLELQFNILSSKVILKLRVVASQGRFEVQGRHELILKDIVNEVESEGRSDASPCYFCQRANDTIWLG